MYSEFVRPGKNLTTGDQIAAGTIELRHLAPGLFAEFRQIALHGHTGVKSRKIQAADLDGAYGSNGILIKSPNGSFWRIKVDNSGNVTATAA